MDVERIIGGGAPDVAIEEESIGGIVINPASDLGKELLKWEQHPGPLGRRPGNPYVYRPYPKMLYRATAHPESGKPTCMAEFPNPWLYADAAQLERATQAMEAWNKAHQKIVKDESEHAIATGQGWAESPKAALDLYEQQQIGIAAAAAEAEFSAKRMSEKAQRELKAAHDETHEHIVDVQPKKRGRKPKAVSGSGPVES